MISVAHTVGPRGSFLINLSRYQENCKEQKFHKTMLDANTQAQVLAQIARCEPAGTTGAGAGAGAGDQTPASAAGGKTE